MSLLLTDTASLYFRAFYGVPDSVRAPDGTPVGAVHGLLDMFATLIGRYRPSHLVACLDADWRPAWRVDLLPSYKGHRVAEDGSSTDADRPAPARSATGDGGASGHGGASAWLEEMPAELGPQVDILLELLPALGLCCRGAPGYEADDVIGTLAHRASQPVDVVTGDRDLFQLVDDARDIRVLYTARGVSRLEELTEASVRERYDIPASSYVDFAVLRGDPSDGLPGVKGIGDKTAARLLAAFGDLAGIQEAAAAGAKPLSARQAAAITEAGDYLAKAPTVVRLADGIDLNLAPEDFELARRSSDEDRLQDLSQRWGVGHAVGRLQQALSELD